MDVSNCDACRMDVMVDGASRKTEREKYFYYSYSAMWNEDNK
jgi:hypothetical protein